MILQKTFTSETPKNKMYDTQTTGIPDIHRVQTRERNNSSMYTKSPSKY